MLDNIYTLFFIAVGFIGLMTLLFMKRTYDIYQFKKLDKAAREFDVKVKQNWDKKNAEAAVLKAEKDKRIAEEIEAERKKEAETLNNLQANFAEFFDSPENIFIARFAERYPDETAQKELPKLQSLLKNRQWNFSLLELKLLVDREVKKQHVDDFSSKISSGMLKERQEIINAYLDNYSPDNEAMLEILAENLSEKNLYKGSLPELKTEIEKIKEKIEADKFASFLITDSKS